MISSPDVPGVSHTAAYCHDGRAGRKDHPSGGPIERWLHPMARKLPILLHSHTPAAQGSRMELWSRFLPMRVSDTVVIGASYTYGRNG